MGKSRIGQAPGRLGMVGMSNHLLREPQSAVRVVKKAETPLISTSSQLVLSEKIKM